MKNKAKAVSKAIRKKAEKVLTLKEMPKWNV